MSLIMNKQKIFGVSLVLIMLSISLVSASIFTCEKMGHGWSEEVECPSFAGPLLLIGLIAALAFFVFWIWMFIDAIRFEEERKAMWIILMIFVQITAIIYYFVKKRKRV